MMILKTIFFKLLRGFITLFGGLVIVFLLMHAIPGNPWSNYSASPRMLPNMLLDPIFQKEMARRFGADQPLLQQFTRYMVGYTEDGNFICGVICGNLGPSFSQRGRTIQDILFYTPEGQSFWKSRIGYSLRFSLLAAFFVIIFGIPAGILMGVKPTARLSRATLVFHSTLVSIPNFILGLMVMMVFGLWLKWVTVVPNWERPADWILPALVLAAMPMANLARVTRTVLMGILGEDFIRTARAKGLTRARIYLVHVLLNGMPLILMEISTSILELFAGLFVVEGLFGFPGIGREYWYAVLELNYPMAMGLTLIYACAIVMVNFLVEIACYLVDPRLKSIQMGEAL